MDSPKIFKATYSNVPVYEMMCKGVAVMRRRSDSYLNATQILKVADFDKPQRTRILERDVQTGEHEKVQGGYGKYQGTWVPLERAIELAKQYDVAALLEPIFEFVKGAESPPLAPKHLTAASARPKKPREPRVRKKPRHFDESEDDSSQYSEMAEQHHTARSRSVSPLRSGATVAMDSQRRTRSPARLGYNGRKRKQEPMVASESPSATKVIDLGHSYAQVLYDYFITDDLDPPALLLRPPRDLDVNMVLDDEGHTCLHWAAATSRIKTVELLTVLGADKYSVNYDGQTALMRSVLSTNNYDLKSFDELLDLLKKTIFKMDKKDQTVFHHIASTAHLEEASRYYMRCLVDKLKHRGSKLISLLNVQDVHGDTALMIASRFGNKSVVSMLVEAGASTELKNDHGLTSQDYLVDQDRPAGLEDGRTTRDRLRQKMEKMYKLIDGTERSGTTPSLSHTFDGFAASYERDLTQKEQYVQEKHTELSLARKKLDDTKRTLDTMVKDATTLAQEDQHSQQLEQRLRKTLHYLQKERLAHKVRQYDADMTEMTTHNASPLHVQDLHRQLTELQQGRQSMMEAMVQLYAQIPSQRLQRYKRLISMCCNVRYESVDATLPGLLALFDRQVDS